MKTFISLKFFMLSFLLTPVFVFMGLCTYQAKAQWAVIDPSNLAQNKTIAKSIKIRLFLLA